MSHPDIVVQSYDETVGQIAGNDVRTRNDVADVSRAQLVSSDVQREPRRPSMNLEPDNREILNAHARRESLLPPRIEDTRRASVGHTRRENGHIQRNLTNSSTEGRRESQTVRDQQIGTLRDLRPENVRRREFQGVSSARTRGSIPEDPRDKDDRYVVPALPMPVAILCCILNFLVPGLGSMAASVCVFCCAKTDDMTFDEKCGSCCTVFGIGVLQLILVACFLVGWVWSCIWGVTFIGMSASYYKVDEDVDDDIQYNDSNNSNPSNGYTNNPVYQRSQRGHTPLPTPQVVVDQPYPGIHYDDLQRERLRRREAHRRSRSRISLTPSNLIYPMRAPSNIAYNSPPPPYRATPEDPTGRHHRQTNETIQEEEIRR